MTLSGRRSALAALTVASALIFTLWRCNLQEPSAVRYVELLPPLLTADGHKQQVIPQLNPPQRIPGSVRLVLLSDTHTHHSELDVPDGDILIHAGDYALARTSAGRLREKQSFDEW